jgi:propanol-preferring alcohol dehydrogenase
MLQTKSMKAMLLRGPGPISSAPLELTEMPIPAADAGEVLIRVQVCGICRTDLHVVEGELPKRLSPVIPGHQVVGVVEELGAGVEGLSPGQRVGVAWLHHTCGACAFCRSSRENLCESAQFTGYSVQGGFAEYTVAHAQFVYPIPEGFGDFQAAPLLCAGIIGFRCLRIANVQSGTKLGFYGFGAAAHVAIQVARHWGAQVFVCTRDERHQKLAGELGATWTGGAMDQPPEQLDAAIIFAPAGELVPASLAALSRGGVSVLGGIHMSDIPSFPYELIYGERALRSVMNNTRADGYDFLRLAAEIPIDPQVEVFPLADANIALAKLKNDAIRGAALLRIAP